MDDDIWLVTVPGWQDSGPKHWQTLWERGYPFSCRVQQQSWESPVCRDWVEGLNETLRRLTGKVVLVAHSLGCLTVIHWAAQTDMRTQTRIKGTLLVAPPDVENPFFLVTVPAQGFMPVPESRLLFSSHVVASTDDPFCSIEQAGRLASLWGADFTEVGEKGHLNALSGLRDWEVGQRILQRLMLS